MALRLIEMICSDQKRAEVEDLVNKYEPLGLWHDRLMDGQVMVKILLPADRAEAVLDRLESRYSRTEGFQILLLAVEAALPRPEPPAQAAEEGAPDGPSRLLPGRISRQELYAQVSSSARLTKIFLIMTGLSSIVAALGMHRNNVAVIIGAMVIAPLLGVNVALALAATLGDGDLGRRALRTNLMGILTAFILALLLGTVLRVSPAIPEVLFRAQVCLADVALALAAGTVGALAYTTGIHTPLVGVMVAVALLPPLVASGLSFGSAQWRMGLGAMLLFLANLIGINLAAVATFLAHGIRPRTWWEADKAKKASRRAVMLWVLLLLTLVAVIVMAQRHLQPLAR